MGKLFDSSYSKEKEQKKGFEKLTEEIEQLKNLHQGKTKAHNKKNETSISIQLLILHYLGFLHQIKAKNNKAKAELLSKLFNTEGIENIRKGLSIAGAETQVFSQKTILN
jgi:hypothetical protein